MDRQPPLSVIITSHTTERRHDIDELLDSIKGQTYPNIETIFVAERSAELLNKAKEYVEKENMLDVLVIFNSGMHTRMISNRALKTYYG